MNKRLFLTVGMKGDNITPLYIGFSKGEAREAFNAHRLDNGFDFVGSQVIPGFRSRSRPIILEAEEAQRAERAIKEQTEAATLEARQAQAAKKALAEAALEAEARADEAAEKLKELKAAQPKKRGRKPKKDKGAEAGAEDLDGDEGDADGDDLDGTEDPEDDGLADLVK